MQKGNTKGPWFFTKENARVFALQGIAKQRELKRKAAAELQVLKDAPVQRILKAIETQPIRTEQAEENTFTAKRLACVRTQLQRLDAMILVEEDPARLDKLASAQAKLSEQERILDGRPLPGSHRPTRAPRRAQEPTDLEPE